jgi:MATE family multidrug resistance protein
LNDLKKLLTIAGPIVIVQVGLVAMGMVDTIMVGRVSPAAIAAVALASTLFMVVGTFGMGVIMSLDAVVAQAIGADDRPAAVRAFQRAVVLSGILAVPTVLVLCLAEPLLRWTGQPAEVVPLAWNYMKVALPGVLPFYWFVVMRQTLQAMHRLRPILVTILVANLLNAFLNWVFVYGNLGAPAMGVVGSSLATVIGRFVMTALLLAISWGTFGPMLRPFAREAFAPAPLLRFALLGAPIGAQFVLEIGVFSLIGFLMGRLGTIALAGHQIALLLASFTFMVPLGLSMAAAVLVGRAVGAHDPAAMRKAARLSYACAIGFGTFSATMMLLFARPIVSVYSPDPAVRAIAATLLGLAGLFQVFDGMQVTGIGILRGIGDTRAPLFANIVGYWVLGLPLSLFLAFTLGLGAPGLWWGFVLGLAVVALWMLLRVRTQMGRTQERIVLEDEPAGT